MQTTLSNSEQTAQNGKTQIEELEGRGTREEIKLKERAENSEFNPPGLRGDQ